MATEEDQQPRSVSDLLNTIDEDRDGMVLCTTCGQESPEGTRECPKCGERISWPTLAECGKKLPIGIEENGQLSKAFDLIPMNWKLEKKIGDSWEGRRGQITISDYIGTILAHTVTQIGSNTEFQKHKFQKRLLIFNQMYSADVYYLYAYLRFLTLGKELKIDDMPCPNCSTRFPFAGDLTSLEIVVATDLAKLTKKITLRDGFALGGEQRFGITVKPTRWNMLGSGFAGAASDAKMFAVILMNAIDGVEGLPDGATITEREIEQFTKYDMAVIEDEMDDVVCGPRWEVEGTCPQCQSSFFHILDWSYENFFAISSRSPRQRRRSRMR